MINKGSSDYCVLHFSHLKVMKKTVTDLNWRSALGSDHHRCNSASRLFLLSQPLSSSSSSIHTQAEHEAVLVYLADLQFCNLRKSLHCFGWKGWLHNVFEGNNTETLPRMFAVWATQILKDPNKEDTACSISLSVTPETYLSNHLRVHERFSAIYHQEFASGWVME